MDWWKALREILLLQLCVLGISGIRSYGKVRLCDDDFDTPGRCFVTVDKKTDWASAEAYCKTHLPRPGNLAAIEDKYSQDIVKAQLQSVGWDNAWINGFLKHHMWFWQKHWQQLAYQGCWRDDPNNRELPIEITVSNGSDNKPSECLAECAKKGSPEDHYFVGIQLDAAGKMMCRCGKKYGVKHIREFAKECDTPCPGSGGLTGGLVMDKTCGGLYFQLIYYVKGTLFHAFANTYDRDYEHCVVFDAAHSHRWAEHSCHDTLPFICDYDLMEWDCKRRDSYKWVAGACITIETAPKNFYAAQSHCFAYQADLLKVINHEVYKAVVALLDPNESYFFALTDEEWLFSYWQYVFRYFNWGEGQPAQGVGQECFQMKGSDGYRWHNIDCGAHLPFVCMVDIQMTVRTVSQSKTTAVPHGNATGAGKILGASEDLFIGLAVGVGCTLVLAIIVGLCIFCVQRRKGEKRSTDRKDSSNQQEETRELPQPPSEKRGLSNPTHHGGGHNTFAKNTAYNPDVVGHPRPARGRGDTAMSNDPHYMDLGESNERGSDHMYDDIREGDHMYEDMQSSDNYDYVQPVN